MSYRVGVSMKNLVALVRGMVDHKSMFLPWMCYRVAPNLVALG